MAQLSGIKGSVTVKIGESVIVHEFTLPLNVVAAFDKDRSIASFKVDGEPFQTAVTKLGDWLRDFPVFTPPSDTGTCVCMQAWNSVAGRTCPAHGYTAPMQVTC